eukprot:TRINITY_DN4865_c0_g1_i1.p1 TRINITY_DN4865_c0_g1~~TRINITY_DN4865_c0_g1_i1.p1  ORF type:complete len:147 (+),score=33.30 TRINITY_DN4865_c0_g1_i1:310-750(+)
MAASLASMVGADGEVITIDVSQSELDIASDNIKKHLPDIHPIIKFKKMNALDYKVLEELGVFRSIHVGVAVKFLPSHWISALDVGGGMTVPQIFLKKNDENSEKLLDSSNESHQTLLFLKKTDSVQYKAFELCPSQYDPIKTTTDC